MLFFLKAFAIHTKRRQKMSQFRGGYKTVSIFIEMT